MYTTCTGLYDTCTPHALAYMQLIIIYYITHFDKSSHGRYILFSHQMYLHALAYMTHAMHALAYMTHAMHALAYMTHAMHALAYMTHAMHALAYMTHAMHALAYMTHAMHALAYMTHVMHAHVWCTVGEYNYTCIWYYNVMCCAHVQGLGLEGEHA